MSAEECHPELQCLRTHLQHMLDSMSTFGPRQPKPPIIDSSCDPGGNSPDDVQRREAVRGMRALKDSVKRDLDVLEKFLADPECARRPALSTNAPYLISVWKEVLCAPPPVTAIWSTYSETGRALHPRKRGLPKEAGVKVDVVADGGRQWIRVNTTKNSRMLAEFREIDSYLTDSEDESDAEGGHLPSLAQKEFDNSVLRMGRALLVAARENPLPGTAEVSAVTLRLTRLDPSPTNTKDHDPRIARTIDELRALGIDVQLGERPDDLLSAPPEDAAHRPRTVYPTRQIKLDLSILIALVSDLTHAPLPSSADEADACFTPGAEYVEWKKKRIAALKAAEADGDTGEPEVDYVGRPSRALVTQVLQEMSKGLLDDISEKLSAISPDPSSPPSGIQFWTTPEAKARCLQIVGKIGGPQEQARAAALFAPDLAHAQDAYWAASRFPRAHVPLLPIRLLPPGLPDDALSPPRRADTGAALSPFFHALARTCRAILREEPVPHPRAGDTADAGDGDGEIRRAAVTRASARLTAHTVQSLLWGAVRGWTTLTANKTSVRAMLKQMRAARHGVLWDRADEDPAGDDPASEGGLDAPASEPAAIWMVDPRSLAEGMRADFGSA